MLFWITAILLALLVGAALAAALLRRQAGPAAPEAPGASDDAAFYRAQMAEIDRDLDRGLIAPEEAEQARTEIARRLLAASRGGAAGPAPAGRRASLVAAAAIGLLLLVGVPLLYAALGQPGAADRPRAARLAEAEALRDSRPSQAEAEAAAPARPMPEADPAYLESVARLREVVPTRPEDLTGWQLLSQHEANLGQYAAAARAQEQVIALLGESAGPEDRIALADRLVAAANGVVTRQTEALLQQVLEVRPQDSAALYYMGLLYAQTGRPDLAFRAWREAVETGAPGSPHVALARAQVEDAADAAGVPYTPPAMPAPSAPPVLTDPDQPGPTAEDLQAAQDLTPEQQQEMARGMVERLAARLAEQGGPATDWARLIRTLGVLGETERAAAIWAEAETVFAGTEGLEAIREAARAAGIDTEAEIDLTPGAEGAE